MVPPPLPSRASASSTGSSGPDKTVRTVVHKPWMLAMLVPSGTLVGAPGSPTGLPTSFPEALTAYAFLSRDGDGAANAGMGTLELFGWGVDLDTRKALDHFRAANDRGHARGKTGLGILYANGQAVEPDYPRAFKLLSEGSVAVRG